MIPTTIDAARLLGALADLGRIGLDADGRRTRLAATDA
jgi:N-carbamoyl-L-amino-acid hydrolase